MARRGEIGRAEIIVEANIDSLKTELGQGKSEVRDFARVAEEESARASGAMDKIGESGGRAGNILSKLAIPAAVAGSAIALVGYIEQLAKGASEFRDRMRDARSESQKMVREYTDGFLSLTDGQKEAIRIQDVFRQKQEEINRAIRDSATLQSVVADVFAKGLDAFDDSLAVTIKERTEELSRELKRLGDESALITKKILEAENEERERLRREEEEARRAADEERRRRAEEEQRRAIEAAREAGRAQAEAFRTEFEGVLSNAFGSGGDLASVLEGVRQQMEIMSQRSNALGNARNF